MTTIFNSQQKLFGDHKFLSEGYVDSEELQTTREISHVTEYGIMTYIRKT
jgi:hypothetical protein